MYICNIIKKTLQESVENLCSQMNLVSTSHTYISFSSCCICHIYIYISMAHFWNKCFWINNFGISVQSLWNFSVPCIQIALDVCEKLPSHDSDMFRRHQFMEAINETCASSSQISILTDREFGHIKHKMMNVSLLISLRYLVEDVEIKLKGLFYTEDM